MVQRSVGTRNDKGSVPVQSDRNALRSAAAVPTEAQADARVTFAPIHGRIRA
jgi:hypothetical protein